MSTKRFEQKAGAHRRIEERVAVGVSEGRRPVVTGRHVEEERLFEAERDSSEDRVEPFALQSHGRAVHVEIRRVEDVGIVGAAVARSDELALLVEQAHVVRTCLHHAGAEGGVEREIVPRMVVLGEQVRIELFAEVAVVVHFAVGVFIAVGRRVVVAYVVFVGALVAHAARERKSVDDLVFDRSAEFVAVAFDDGAFAVEQPVGVAVGLVGGSHPVLDVGVELAVVGLEVAFVAVPVAAARESVGADERVEDETAGRLVRDVLVHVFGVEIDLDVVVERSNRLWR